MVLRDIHYSPCPPECFELMSQSSTMPMRWLHICSLFLMHQKDSDSDLALRRAAAVYNMGAKDLVLPFHCLDFYMTYECPVESFIRHTVLCNTYPYSVMFNIMAGVHISENPERIQSYFYQSLNCVPLNEEI